MCCSHGINKTKQPVDAQQRVQPICHGGIYIAWVAHRQHWMLPLTNEDRRTASGNFFYSFISSFLHSLHVFIHSLLSSFLLLFCSRYRPVLILQACQGALELLLVLVLQVGQQHVLSAGWLVVQGWAGVTQEVLIFIPESPTQETAHWATSTQPTSSTKQSQGQDGTRPKAGWPSEA